MHKTETITDENGVIIKTKDLQYNIFDDEKGYLFKYKTSYSKSFHDVKLTDKLTNKIDIANMYILAENMYKDTNMIAYRYKKKYYSASIEHIAEMLGIRERATKEFINKMMSLGIIARVEIKTEDTNIIQYYVNPLYFMTNKRLTHSLYMLFQKQLDEHLPRWVIDKMHEITEGSKRS